MRIHQQSTFLDLLPSQNVPHSSYRKLMESQASLDRFDVPSSYRQNLLQAKAETSIKRHQVRGFINAGEGLGKMGLSGNDENSQLAQHLMQLKTSCSGVRLDIRHRQLEQFKYKDEAQLIAQRTRTIHQGRAAVETEIAKLRGVVGEVREKRIAACLTTKSYEHILDRMKKDQIRAQMRRNQLERDLKRMEKQLTELTAHGYELKEYEFMSSSGLKEAEEEVRDLEAMRQSTVADMHCILEEKEVLGRKRQERKEKSDMIKEMAAGDLQDADLIRMKRFLTVQGFLKSLLKAKMERLKDFYSPYELAFLKIKSNTSVKDATSLKAEFRNFEASYNERASWVKHLEEEIAVLEQEQKALQLQMQEAKSKELEVLQQLEAAHQPEVSPVSRELETKAEQSEVLLMSVHEWLREQARRMKLDPNKPDTTLLKEVCSQLMKKSKRV